MERIVNLLNSAKSPLHWVAFAGFLLFAMFLRLAAFQGYSDSDPRYYSILANDLAHGTIHIPQYDHPPVFPLRLGVYAPTAKLISIFGLSEATLAAYPFVVSILGCLLAYAIARYLESPLAGLIALGALAVLPIELTMASILFPDAIAAFWANVGIAFALIASNRPNLRQSVFLGILSGVFFGVSWLCKESVIYLVPFVAILTLACPGQIRLSGRMACVVAIGAGSLAVLIAETALYQRLTGDPLFRFHATERNYQEWAVWFFDESSPYFGWKAGGYAKAILKRLLIVGPKSMLLNREMGFVPTFAMVGLVWGIQFRNRFFVIPSIWLVSLMMMFNFMTSSFSSYRPLPLFDRYLYAIILPSVILMAGFLAKLLVADAGLTVGKERRFWAVVLILAFCGICGANLRSHMSRVQQVERTLTARLGEGDVIYTDYRTAANLVFFRAGLLVPSTATTIPWEKESEQTIPEGAYVFVNKSMINFLKKTYKYESPEFAARTPAKWERVLSLENGDLYVVRGR